MFCIYKYDNGRIRTDFQTKINSCIFVSYIRFMKRLQPDEVLQNNLHGLHCTYIAPLRYCKDFLGEFVAIVVKIIALYSCIVQKQTMAMMYNVCVCSIVHFALCIVRV